MAKVVGGVGSSHIPVIGVAVDAGKTEEPYFAPYFEGLAPARKWIEEQKPDVVFLVYNDHANAFSVEFVPTFAIGVGDEFEIHDEGYGKRRVPTVHGHSDLAAHVAEELILDHFDMVIANHMTVDHGLTVPMSIMFDQPPEWPVKVIPFPVNVIKYPQPTGQRCFDIGVSIRKAIESFPEDLRVCVFGTGGMGHQLQGERVGLINKEFDTHWLDNLGPNPEELIKIGHTQYLREAGSEGIELIMWLIMRGALKDPKEVYRHYHVPMSNTAAGLICYDDGENA